MKTRTKKVYSSIDEVMDVYLWKNNYEGSNSQQSVFFYGNTLYSYGYHFPLAVKVKDYYLINGDGTTTTTSKHRMMLFSKIYDRNRATIPFSALNQVFRRDGESIYSVNTRDEVLEDFKIIDKKDEEWIPTDRVDSKGRPIFEHRLEAVVFSFKNGIYVSSIDPTGNGVKYFLSELPYLEVPTVDGAFQSLKPAEVLEAENKGIEVYRQGEFFFIPTGYKDKDIDFTNKTVVKNFVIPNKDKRVEFRHYATKGFITEDNEVWVQGIVRHNLKEHKQLKLYETGTAEKEREWFKVYENTAIMSWSAEGNVD